MLSRRAVLLSGLRALSGTAKLAAWFGLTGELAGTACKRDSRTASETQARPQTKVADLEAPDAHGPSATAPVTLIEWTMPSPIERVVVMVPGQHAPEQRFPVVVALHGRGEALKEPALGAMGWPHDYALDRAYTRMLAPPLTADDFEGLVEPPYLASLNRALAEHPFGKLIIACPYVPDLDMSSAADADVYGRAIVSDLLPRVRNEAPALVSAEATGIDGVSLGGITALRVGLSRPESFGAVGALQPAIRDTGLASDELTGLAKNARAKRPGMKLRLTTSERDGFRRAVTRTSDAWRAAGIVHDFAVLPGPHDYVFNRGPGAIELLFWHDRVLSRA